MFNKPKLLLGSSRQEKDSANQLKALLSEWADIEIWSGIFDLSEITLVALDSKLPKFDMCVFMWLSDESNNLQASRESLAFELGFIRKLMDKNNIVVVAGSGSSIIPESVFDLDSVTFITIDTSESLDSVSARIKEHFEKKIIAPFVDKDIRPKPMLPRMLPKDKNLWENNVIEKYWFPKKYTATGDQYEFALCVFEDRAILTDQGRTLKMLDKVFELSEADVRKNLDAITRELGVAKVGDDLVVTIPDWQQNPTNANYQIQPAVFRLFSCVVFMDTMRIFYV